MSSSGRKTFRQIWWAPLLCFGLAGLLGQTDKLKQFEWKTLDWRTQFRALLQAPPDPRIVIALYEDGTDANLVSWPPDRAWHGNFNKFAAVLNPSVICWDIILDASREGEGDASMAQDTKAAIEAGVMVVTAAVTSSEPPPVEPDLSGPTLPLRNFEGDRAKLTGEAHALVPFPELKAVAPYGFADAPRYGDGIIRQIPLVLRIGEEVYPSLALQTVLQYYRLLVDDVRVRLGDGIYLKLKSGEKRIPIDSGGNYLINFRYDQYQDADGQTYFDFPTHTYQEILLKVNAFHVEHTPAAIPPPDLGGKILFVGQTVTGKADAGPTQLNAYSPLVLVHANVVQNILREDYARRVPEAAIWICALLLGWLGLVLVADRSLMLLCSGAVFGVVAYSSAAAWAWVWGSWWMQAVAPLTGFIGLQFIVIGRRVWQEQKAKQEIKGMFGSYVSPQLVDRLIQSGQPPKLGGHEEEITAYFSDIQGYSTFSEKLTPPRLVVLLNTYLTACTDIVQEEGGTLDKYIGDAVVAMFGAPIEQKEHAYRACVAALRVQARLGELRTAWEAEGEVWPISVRQMRTRVGLNTGPAIVGNMGSRTRFNYTMTGDHVNLAARMESGAKSWGAFTMCTESTRAGCVQHGGDRVVFRPLGRIVVKGRSQAVPIFELTGLKEDVTERTRECLGVFAAGLERYYARDWDQALALFKQSEALEPLRPGEAPGVGSNPSIIYQDIVRHYRADPPPEDWDGVYVMKEK